MKTTTTTGNDNKEEIQFKSVTENVQANAMESCVPAVSRCTYRMTRAGSTARNTYYLIIIIFILSASIGARRGLSDGCKFNFYLAFERTSDNEGRNDGKRETGDARSAYHSKWRRSKRKKADDHDW